MKLENQQIEDAFNEVFSMYPNEVKQRHTIANDFFFNGVRFAEKECQCIIDKCLENNAENVSFGAADAEQEQDKKYLERLKEMAARFHKGDMHIQGNTIEYVIDNLF